MKKFTRPIILSFLFLGFSALSASAQDATTTTVKFARGKSSATYTGRISKSEGVQHYELSARAGQRITISVSSANKTVKFMLFESASTGVLNSNGKSWSGTLETGGDYVITVASRKGKADYRLNISIR